MAITNNLFKLRSTLVRYEKFNKMLPKRTATQARFSDIDMFHAHMGHRLFIELKHVKAWGKQNRGLSVSIDRMFKSTMRRGDFCLVLWGEYEDNNFGTDEYFSDFTPSKARIYHPLRDKVIEYQNIDDKWLERFFSYWYKYAETNPLIEDLEIDTTEVITYDKDNQQKPPIVSVAAATRRFRRKTDYPRIRSISKQDRRVKPERA